MIDQHHDARPEPECEPALFIEFANRLRIEDTSDDVAALRAWLAEHRLVTRHPSHARLERALPSFRELHVAVRGVADRVSAGAGPTPRQVGAINRSLRDGLHYHALRTSNGDRGFRMVQVGDELEQARASIANSLAHFLADHDASRLGVCANDECGWLFVDRSPARRRRWCDMRSCGNRAKVARHRARARTASA